MKEEWKHIPGFPAHCEASNLGRIRSHSRTHYGLHRIFIHGKYYKVQLCGKQYFVSLVCAAFHGLSPSSTHQAAHKNGLELENNPDNLYWATPAENGADTARHGSLKYEQHPRAKLSIMDVEEIKQRRSSGEQIKSIHKDFQHVCYATISHICNNRNWKSRESFSPRREIMGLE